MANLAGMRDRWLEPVDGIDVTELLDQFATKSDCVEYMAAYNFHCQWNNQSEEEFSVDSDRKNADCVKTMQDIENQILSDADCSALERSDIEDYFTHWYKHL